MRNLFSAEGRRGILSIHLLPRLSEVCSFEFICFAFFHSLFPQGNIKRPRVSEAIGKDDDEDEEEGEEENLIAFSQRLSRYKRPPVQKGLNFHEDIILSINYPLPAKSRSRVPSDDDFIVPDDSEDEASCTKSRKSSSRRSSISSHRSTASEHDDDFEEETLDVEEAPNKTKSRGKGKNLTTKSAGSKIVAGLGGTFAFLTAAEQREQGKKEGKKAAEEPYSFLQDVRDVSSACIE